MRAQFSAYLDGDLSGIAMAALAAHLDRCPGCDREFAAWRGMQHALSTAGPVQAPARLQADLRSALAAEAARGTHLPLSRRGLAAWRTRLAPFALQAAGGFALALVMLAGLGWLFAAPLAVEANDDNQAHLTSPRYLYSEVPPQPISTSGVPLLIDARIDATGRVYDYTILAGPATASVRARLDEDLLASVFKPATVFGEPVRGHVVLTYTGVSVHG